MPNEVTELGSSVQVIATLAEAIAAVGAVLIAVAVYRFSRLQHSTQMRTQRAVQIHEWCNACLCAITEAEHFCMLQVADFPDSGAYNIRQNDLLHRLSALIEQGRLFFRNVHQDKYGQEKFPARRGYRPEILDPVVAAYEAVRAKDATYLHKWLARFVSLIQYEVDPAWLREATYYPSGPGAQAGTPVSGADPPPPWPQERRPASAAHYLWRRRTDL